MILYKLNYLFDQANISEKQRKYVSIKTDADGTDLNEFKQLRTVQENITSFVDKGQQLYIHSTICGNGKTLWALRLMQTYFKKIWLTSSLRCRGLFIGVPALLLALKDNISNKNDYVTHIKQNIYEADLVIWDDIGTKGLTVFEQEHLFAMIDQRINSGKANIFTSNLNSEELHETLGDRLASRICNLSLDVEFHGGDKRNI